MKCLDTNFTNWFVLAIRDTASVLLTNIVGSQLWILKYPVFLSLLQDTIHASILPHEERWRRSISRFHQEIQTLTQHPLGS
jgi:hypothetical protein